LREGGTCHSRERAYSSTLEHAHDKRTWSVAETEPAPGGILRLSELECTVPRQSVARGPFADRAYPLIGVFVSGTYRITHSLTIDKSQKFVTQLLLHHARLFHAKFFQNHSHRSRIANCVARDPFADRGYPHIVVLFSGTWPHYTFSQQVTETRHSIAASPRQTLPKPLP
jgi:hypothetical protein